MKHDLSINEVRQLLSREAGGVPYKLAANEAILQAIKDGIIAPFIDDDNLLAFVRIDGGPQDAGQLGDKIFGVKK